MGTLDQALMAVMPFKHNNLRLLGLDNKVLLADEIHAYDAYMSRILESLIEQQARSAAALSCFPLRSRSSSAISWLLPLVAVAAARLRRRFW